MRIMIGTSAIMMIAWRWGMRSRDGEGGKSPSCRHDLVILNTFDIVAFHSQLHVLLKVFAILTKFLGRLCQMLWHEFSRAL
jgi:hypothetical protein